MSLVKVGGRAKNPSLSTWNVTSFSSYFLFYSRKYCLQMVQSQNHHVPLCYYPDGFTAAGKPFCCLVLGARFLHGMVLLRIHPVPRCKNPTSITLTGWFAVVSFKSQPGLGRMDRKAWGSRVLLGSNEERLRSLQEKLMPWWISCLGVRLYPLSHLTSQRRWENAQHSSRGTWFAAGASDFFVHPLARVVSSTCQKNLEEIIKDVIPRGRPELPGNPGKGPLHLTANIWLWLPLETPIFRLPSACPESWACPKHHSTLKRDGEILTSERNFFLATTEENPKLCQRTVTPKEQSPHFPLRSEMGKQQSWSSRLGPGSPAGYSPCSGYAVLNFPTCFGWQQCFWNSIHGNYGLASLPTLGWQLALAGALQISWPAVSFIKIGWNITLPINNINFFQDLLSDSIFSFNSAFWLIL